MPEHVQVALNAQLLSNARSFRSGGISRVIYHLLHELARDTRGHQYEAFLPEAPRADDPLGSGRVKVHPTGRATARPPVRIAWEQSLLPWRLAGLRPDLLHGLAYALPLAWRGPSVLTIYDLSFLRFPDAFQRANRLYLSTVTRLSARRARRVITISEHSKDDIIRLLGVAQERVDVAYPAADARYRPLPKQDVQRFRDAHGLPDTFIFYVGTLEPRKNLTGLLDAYARLRAPRPPLYVAGAAGWRFTPIFEKVRDLGLESDVHFLGFVPEDELPLWYNAARLFAYPSLYEGFGLPVVEAMACGTPAITTRAASLPEVAGQAAILVPPNDAAALAEEMDRLLQDPDLRNHIRAAGLIQAGRFTWHGMADVTVRSYELAVSRGAA